MRYGIEFFGLAYIFLLFMSNSSANPKIEKENPDLFRPGF